MKGNNLVKVPGELYAPTSKGRVVSADGVYDYIQGKNQEQINEQVVETSEEAKQIAQQAAASASSMENIVNVLRDQGEQDIATALDHEARIQSNTSKVNKLVNQLGDYAIILLSESEYEELVASGELDSKALYFTYEDETD